MNGEYELIKIIYVAEVLEWTVYNNLKTSNNKFHSPAQIFHYNTINAFIKKGISVEVISKRNDITNFNNKGFENNINFHYIPSKRIKAFISLYLNLSKIKKNSAHSCVIINDSTSVSNSLMSTLFSKLKNVRLYGIFTDHPKYYFKKRWLHSLYVNSLSAVFSVTEQLNNDINRKKIPFLIYPGCVNIDELDQNYIDYSQRDKIIVYSGGISRNNGLIEFIKAFSSLRLEGFKFDLYGKYEGNDNAELKELIQKDNKVTYMGVVNYDELRVILSKAYAVVNPRYVHLDYIQYSFPIKTLDYLAAATAFVSTKLVCYSDDLLNNIVTIEENTVESIRETLYDLLLKTPKELNVMATNSKKFFLENYSCEKTINQMIEILSH